MKQISKLFAKIEEFEIFLVEVKESKEYQNSSDILLIFCQSEVNEKVTENVTSLVSDTLPKVKIVGCSIDTNFSSDMIKGGMFVSSILFFEKSYVDIYEYDADSTDEELIAQNISEHANTMDCKGMFLLMNVVAFNNQEQFFEKLTIDSRKVAAMGVCASVKKNLHGDIFIYGKNIYKNGVIAVFLRGESLFCKTICATGWQKMGILHEITCVPECGIVTSIDGMTIADAYKKYANLIIDSANDLEVMGYPLLKKVGDTMIPRSCLYRTEEGGLFFPGKDLHLGDKVYFSIGYDKKILKSSRRKVCELVPFQAEGLLVTICLERLMYLKDSLKVEYGFFKSLCPDFGYCPTFGSVVLENGKFIYRNCAISAFALREQEVTNKNMRAIVIPEIEDYNKSDYIFDKMSNMMECMEQDYIELKKKQDELKEVANQKESEDRTAWMVKMSNEVRENLKELLTINKKIYIDSNEENIKNDSKTIAVCGKNITNLLNSIQDYTRVKKKRFKITNLPYSLSAFLNNVDESFREKADKKGIRFFMIIDNNIPDKLFGDEMRLMQVMSGILDNAIKYTDTGSVQIKVDYEEKSFDMISLSIRVSDTGIGMREEDVENLLDSYDYPEKGYEPNEGINLGINIVQSLLSLMNSELKAKSVYGKGSDFWFSINQNVENWNPIGDFKQKNLLKIDNIMMKGDHFFAPLAKILVVDDKDMNLIIFQNLLKRTLVQVDTARLGTEAVGKATQIQYDAIFIDERMPELDGVQTMHIIRKFTKNAASYMAPIIAITSNAIIEQKEKLLNEGFDDVLTKPLSPQEIEYCLSKWISANKIMYSNQK